MKRYTSFAADNQAPTKDLLSLSGILVAQVQAKRVQNLGLMMPMSDSLADFQAPSQQALRFLCIAAPVLLAKRVENLGLMMPMSDSERDSLRWHFRKIAEGGRQLRPLRKFAHFVIVRTISASAGC